MRYRQQGASIKDFRGRKHLEGGSRGQPKEDRRGEGRGGREGQPNVVARTEKKKNHFFLF